MSHNLLRLTNEFGNLRVLVVGEAILDGYLRGPSHRLCREAPVPIVNVMDRTYAPGGAANTAVNVASLGGHVSFLSVMGNDPAGQTLLNELAEHGVCTEHLLLAGDRRTLAKQRIIASSQLVVRFDEGTTEPLTRNLEKSLLRRLRQLYSQHDVIIISDYGYGILTPKVIEALARLQRRCPRPLVLDAKEPSAYHDAGITAVKPNYGEAIELLGLEPVEGVRDRAEQIAAYESDFLQLTGAQIVAVTLDTEGALIFERGSAPYRTYAEPRPNSRAAGAGDSFISAFAMALGAGASTPAAAEIASATASVVVDKDGTTACSLAELRAAVSGEEKYFTDWLALRDRLEAYRRQGRRIVLTNGCFDILHRGHITYLSQAKALGDVLVVGLNSDESVQRLKGPKRPINLLEDRARVLSALSCVDHTVSFGEDTPHRLIETVQPDIFVKGGDYTRETLPEASLVEELGGEVHILPYLERFSTTNIIERIRDTYEPAHPDYYAYGHRNSVSRRNRVSER